MAERPETAAARHLSREAPAGLIVLRVRADDGAARARLGTALGLTLPASPARPTLGPGRRLFWTAPDAFLLDLEPGTSASAECDRLAARLGGAFVAVHDVTDARTRFVVGGAAARALLAKGTGLDLAPAGFPVGAAALTRFAGLAVLLVHRDDAPSYEMLVDRPVEDWLWTWLVDAAREFAESG